MRQKIIYRDVCQICGAKLDGMLDYNTHIKLSHPELYSKITNFTVYESKQGTTVFITKKEEKEKLKEHPMDVVRRKALSWDKHHKFGSNQTIWSVLKNEYGDSGAKSPYIEDMMELKCR